MSETVNPWDGRDRLEKLGPMLAPARELRDLPDEAFDDLDESELDVVARSLRALSYSCEVGARKVESILRRRNA